MAKNKYIKWLIPLGLGLTLMMGGPHLQLNTQATTSVEVFESKPATISASQHTKIPIYDYYLKNALMDILDKKTSDFYADDFITNDKFKATTIVDEETGISVTTALNYQLDLSNRNVTNIQELAQFIFPETLYGINLAGNNITENDLIKIDTLLNYKDGDKFTLHETERIARSDFSNIIKKINLNNNEIDLTKTNSSYLENTTYIFGFQNLGNIDKTGLVKSGEINPMYYIRENTDEAIFSFQIKYALSTASGSFLPLKYNTISTFVDPDKVDKYTISVTSPPSSDTAYFNGYTFTKEFIQFDVSLDPTFRVERMSLCNLNIKTDAFGKIDLTGSPLIVSGFGDNSKLKITYENPSTHTATNDEYKNYLYVNLTYNNSTRKIPLEFIVQDTIKPIIKLQGSKHLYSSKGREVREPGYIAYDPATPNGEDGDSLTQLVVRASTVDITRIGTYKISYTVSDLAGNIASAERIVDVQEKVLDRVILRTDTPLDNIVAGKEIILTVQPESGTPISKYSNLEYTWYVNGKKFQTTKGDKQTGKSIATFIPEKSGTYTFKVEVKAAPSGSHETIEFFSDEIDIQTDKDMSGDDMIILSATIVIGIIILTIVGVSIYKYAKKHKRTSGKRKNFIKGKKPKTPEPEKEKGPEIQVIRNYNPNSNGTTSNGYNTTNDGSSNTQPSDNQDN